MKERELDVRPGGDDLEQALEDLGQVLQGPERALKSAVQAVKRAREATRLGNVREIERRFEAVSEAAATLAAETEALTGAWTFDSQDYLTSGRYLAELTRAADEISVLGVRVVDGRLYSFPHIVRVEGKELSLRIGKRLQRGVRPSHVAQLLKAAQERPSRDNLSPILHAVERAYLLLAKGELGRTVPLTEVHAILTALPGVGYSLDDFVMDIYRLDLNGPHHTRSGHRFDLPASTSARGGKGIRFVTQDGEEKLYSAIRFVKAVP